MLRYTLIPAFEKEKELLSFRNENIESRIDSVSLRLEAIDTMKQAISSELAELQVTPQDSVSDTAEKAERAEHPFDGNFIFNSNFLSLYLDSLTQEFQSVAQEISAGNDVFSRFPVVYPLPDSIGIYKIKDFGMHKGPFEHREKMHNATDYAAPKGSPIIATASGVVKSTGSDNFWGNYIRIRHQQAVETFYAHLDEVFVSSGSSVKKREVIGTVGESGYSVGPHVHYELRINGEAVDPERYMVYGN
ncbi:MAG: M23 family metallopeptidase [Fibrobacterota bacterium]